MLQLRHIVCLIVSSGTQPVASFCAREPNARPTVQARDDPNVIAQRAKCAVHVVRRRQRHVRRIAIGLDASQNAFRAVRFVGKLMAPAMD